MTIDDILKIIGAVFAILVSIITAVYYGYEFYSRRKKNKEKQKEKDFDAKPNIVVQLISEAISPTAAKLTLEIENKSIFDIYDVNIDLNEILKNDFFKLPPIFNSDKKDPVILNTFIEKIIKHGLKLDIIFSFIKKNNCSEAEYGRNIINPYLYLLNIYKEILEDDYLDTIKYFDETYDTQIKIKTHDDVVSFCQLLQNIDWQLTCICNNINEYTKKIQKEYLIKKIKASKRSIIPIIDFQFFVFDINYNNKLEIKYSSKNKIDINLKFSICNESITEEQELKINIKINNTMNRYNIENTLKSFFKSEPFKEWKKRLSDEHKEKFYKIKFEARNDIMVFIKYNSMYYLKDVLFFEEYKYFIELLNDKFKTTQIVISI